MNLSPAASPSFGTYKVDSVDKLHEIAQDITQHLQSGDVLLLTGELGSGKTTFTQCLATELGVREKVTSPTFTVAADYVLSDNHLVDQLTHIDLYRWPDTPPIDDLLHIREILDTAATMKRIVVIEWAEKLGNDLPKNTWQLAFEYSEQPGERVVKISKPSEHDSGS